MSSATKRRGFDQDDHTWFSKEAVKKLRIAQEEIQWLLDRGYKDGPVFDFVGNHYQLSSRQRIALRRASCTRFQALKRKTTLLPLEKAKDGCLTIDGFNLIILLEVALSGSVLILGTDGVLRDLAGLRGSYKMIEQTDQALGLLGETFHRLAVPKVKFLLDSPISNSGGLKNRLLAHASNWTMPVEVELHPKVDSVLSQTERIVTGDSALLDVCSSWVNLSREIVEKDIENVWIVDLGQFDRPLHQTSL